MKTLRPGSTMLTLDLRWRLLESRDRIAAAASIALDGTWHPEG